MERLEGYDMSPYSHAGFNDTGKVGFGIIGVSDGTYQHPRDILEKMMPNGYLGLYHYLRSDRPLQEQIAAFDEAISYWDWDFLALDFERIHNAPLAGRFGEMAKQFMDEFIEAYPGAKMLFYANPSTIQEWLIPYGHTWYQDWDLWIAQYPYYGWNPALSTVTTDWEMWNPRLPAGAKGWKVWQYSAGGNMKAAEYGAYHNESLDLNVFNGTRQDFETWLGIQPEPEPEDCSEVRGETINECINALKELK